MNADLRSWLGLTAGITVAIAAIALGNIGHLVYLMDVHPGVAGWVQAIGSIGALLIAVYVGRMSLVADERRRRQALVDQLATISDAVDMALANFEGVRTAVTRQRQPDLQDAWADVTMARQKPLQDLAAMPLPSWPSAILYSRVLAVADCLAQYRAYIDEILPTIHADPRRWGRAHAWEGLLAGVERDYRQSIAGVTFN